MCQLSKLKKDDLEKCYHCGKPADNVYVCVNSNKENELVDVCDECLKVVNLESEPSEWGSQIYGDNYPELPANNYLRKEILNG